MLSIEQVIAIVSALVLAIGTIGGFMAGSSSSRTAESKEMMEKITRQWERIDELDEKLKTREKQIDELELKLELEIGKRETTIAALQTRVRNLESQLRKNRIPIPADEEITVVDEKPKGFGMKQ